MNTDELGGPPTIRESDLSSQEEQARSFAEDLPRPTSPSSDTDWVSPFTILPPLPALWKNRGQPTLLRSPEERLHQRSASSAYYAAAWGSPYATPSPNRSPPSVQSAKQAIQDSEAYSPLSVRDTNRISGARSQLSVRRRRSVHTDSLHPGRRVKSRERQKSLSERFNWLSESDHSGSEEDSGFFKTPTRDTYVKSLGSNTTPLVGARKHYIHESIETITPDTFNDIVQLTVEDDTTVRPAARMEQAVPEDVGIRPTSTSVDKPLPSLPTQNAINTKLEPISAKISSPESPSRPRVASLQSFQRPKKKVPWKGRTCVIALPLTDREDAGLPPLLRTQEIEERMKRWVNDGYNVTGFTLGDSNAQASGQSRALYPDPAEMYAEHRNGRLHVHIPNQADWDAWVDYLKEEKLRALGVTPSNSDAPLSTQSPFSSAPSRVSSQLPNLVASPPIGTTSANSNTFRVPGNTFSPTLNHSGGVHSQAGSHIASPLGVVSGPMHKYRQSIAYPATHSRITSPLDYSNHQPNVHIQPARQAPNGLVTRQFSPNTSNLQSFGQVLSPMLSSIPSVPSNDGGRVTSQNPTMEQIKQQQQRQQQIHAQMLQTQHQRHKSILPQPPKSVDLPRTPVLDSPTRSTPEIMHPTPRSHRHNLSAALQKGVDDAEAALSSQSSTDPLDAKPAPRPVRENSVLDEEIYDPEQDDLPVLKRPEILAEADDSAEIETNPSIAASPLLIDEEKNPFTDLNSLKGVLNANVQGHTSRTSISKFNVEAPEFDPTKGFSFTQTTTTRPAFAPARSSAAPTATLQHKSQNLSLSKFNVEAPTFTPSFMRQATPQSSAHSTPAKQLLSAEKTAFKFGSQALNVEAPEFKPGQLFSFKAPEFTSGHAFGLKSNSATYLEQPNTSVGSIFGEVVVDPASKVTRRSNKVLPVLKPRSREGTPAESSDVDDEGRVSAPADRQKRARHIESAGDQAPLFADSAPFDHADALSPKYDTSNIQPSSETKTGQKPLNGAKEESDTSRQDTEPEQAQELQSALEIQNKDSQASENVPKEHVKSVVEAAAVANPGTNDTEASKFIEEPGVLVSGEFNIVQADASGSHSNVNHQSEKIELPGSKQRPRVEVVAKDVSESQVSNEMLEAKPTNAVRADDLQNVESADTAREDTDVQPASSILAAYSEPQRSLSALATPFEFRPSAPPFSLQLSESSLPTPRDGLSPASSKALDLTESVPRKQPESRVVPQASQLAAPPPVAKQVLGLQASRFAVPEAELSIPHMRKGKSSRFSEGSNHVASNVVDDKSANIVEPQGNSEPQEATSILLNTNPAARLDSIDPIEDSMSVGQAENDLVSSHDSVMDEPMPSFEEIDAVMKQFEDNPDLGVERNDTPVKSTPLIDMRLPPNFRSDAPSPSPQRLQQDFPQLSLQRRPDFGLGIHKLNDSNGEISDWANDYSPQQEQKLQTRAGFFDEHVNEVVDSVLENRLGPVEQALSTIQRSLARITKARSQGLRSMSTDKQESDADDEDDYDAYEGFSSYQPRSPGRRDRKTESIRAIVAETVAAYQPHAEHQPALDVSEFHAALDEIRQLSRKQQHPNQADFRAVIEEVISAHPHFKPTPITDELETLRERFKLDVNALKSSLRDAEKRADSEAKMRQLADEDLQAVHGKLIKAEERASKLHETHEEAQISLKAFLQEKEAYKNLQARLEDAENLNKEYRLSREDWQDQIDSERSSNRKLMHALQTVKLQHSDQAESRRVLHDQIDGLKERMSQVIHDVALDEAHWREKENRFVVQIQKMQVALDHEVLHRKKAEEELDELDSEHKENVRFRTMHEHAQQELTRLHVEIAQLRTENRTYQDSAFTLERELSHAKEAADAQVARATAKMQAELEAATSLRSDHDAQISRLKSRLDNAEIDLEDQKAKHDTDMAELVDAHSQALHEANEKRENSLQEQHSSHEKKLNDLRERHTRALHNSSDDRHRLEYQLNEKLAFSEDKVKHLESKVSDLEERLEITKSAARAAVEAATAKGVNLPTPAPSVVASPPQRTFSASMSSAKGTDLPEKISPQALRESIMVLQDQLQNREQKIEQLEQELASVDKDAPNKIKERETEVTMLRELLAVRMDDLGEIITILSKSDFDRDAAKDAAIRLKANLQMQQHLKERALAIGQLASGLPSMSSIANLAPSPKSLPMAAAAAWGNWRKARDTGVNAFSNITGAHIEQTPSKSRISSPSSTRYGVMTAPSSTVQRTPAPTDSSVPSPSEIRSLAGAARKQSNFTGPAPRPLRSYSAQPRTLSSRQTARRRESAASSKTELMSQPTYSHPDIPSTPTQSSQGSPSVRRLEFGDDIDEDASPFYGHESDDDDSIGETTQQTLDMTAAEDEAIEA